MLKIYIINMNIIVTGGAGFVGSNLVDRLIDQDHNVLVLDNLEEKQYFTVTSGNNTVYNYT